jgi:hypothetical protein
MNPLMIAFLVILGVVSLVLVVAVICGLVLSSRISREEEERYGYHH